MTPRGLRLRIAGFRQSRALCGPACLKIVLAYFGMNLSENAIAKICRSSPVSGTTGTNLVRGAQRLGFDAQIVDHANFRTVEKWLRRGVPVIVDWMSTVAGPSGRGQMPCGHYSVVCEIDKEHIVLQDPALGRRRRLARKEFLGLWFDFKGVFPRRKDDLIIRRLIVVAPQRNP